MKKIFRFFGLQIHGLFPFIYPMGIVFKRFNLIRGLYFYLRNANAYNKQYKQCRDTGKPFPLKVINNYPCLYERFKEAGSVTKHYFFQDLWAAGKVYESGVERHFDIGSSLEGFVAHCLSFTKVVMLDIRPLGVAIPNLEFQQCDCMDMKNIPSDAIPSLSTLHAVEHFGLGRYGDPIDPDGYIKAIDEIKRVLARNGNLYFAVPVGRQRLLFDSNRIFDPEYVVELFSDLTLAEFSFVNDDNVLVRDSSPNSAKDAFHACGLYHFRKP